MAGRIYDSADTVQKIAEKLIATYHPELASARIAYVFVDKAGTRGGKIVAGKIRRTSGAVGHLLETDFLLEVGLDQWNEMQPQQRLALVDHLLEHAFGEEDENDAGGGMRWSIREPDVREFSTILRRHGAWNADLAGFVSVANSLDVDKLVQDAEAQAEGEQDAETPPN